MQAGARGRGARRRGRRGGGRWLVRGGGLVRAAYLYRSLPEYERLNDLLQSGKSGTMLFSTAYSTAGQLRNEGGTTSTRASESVRAARTQCQIGPRQPSTRPVACAPALSGPGGAKTAP